MFAVDLELSTKVLFVINCYFYWRRRTVIWLHRELLVNITVTSDLDVNGRAVTGGDEFSPSLV